MSSPEMTCAVRLARSARRGARSLSDGARERVSTYLEGRRSEDGGFLGRHGTSDLYYGLFALDCLVALGVPIDWRPIERYLGTLDDGPALDLVHTCCLTRCLARTPGGRLHALTVAQRLDAFRAPGGGYRANHTVAPGSIAATFAVQLAHEELGLHRPDADAWLGQRRCPDGSWADAPGLVYGTTTVTAAAVLMLGSGGRSLEGAAGWLAQRSAPSGGFLSSPLAPAPDLLSTAAALVGLDALGVSAGQLAGPTIELIESLWSDDGGFRGYAGDGMSDCEFTYYALVALGALVESQS